MKKFALNSALFFAIAGAFFLAALLATRTLIQRGGYTHIDSTITTVFLGHSHAENSFNDTIIPNSRNFGSSGESYYYTYIKAGELIRNNPQIKQVFIVLTNNQLTKRADSWTWSDMYLSNTFTKYSAYIGWQDYKLLLQHNWTSVLNAECLSLKQNLYFLLRSGSSGNYMESTDWGHFGSVSSSIAQDEVRAEQFKTRIAANDLSETNLHYLLKIVDLLKKERVSTYLVRCPLHPKYISGNEEIFESTLKSYGLDTLFIDLKKFPLTDGDFIDLEHLNAFGAKKFSVFFEHILETDVLRRKDRNEILAQKLDSLNKLIYGR